MAVIVFGDSITNRASDETGGGWTSRLWAKIAQNHFTEHAPGVVTANHSVLELGIGGDTILGVASRLDNELDVRIDIAEDGKLDEVTVGIAVGINDSRILEDTGESVVSLDEFERMYRNVIARVKEKGITRCFVVGLTPVDESKMRPCAWIDPPTSYTNASKDAFDSVIRVIAEDTGVAYINVDVGYAPVIAEKGYDSLLSDGLHPNGDGHQLIADAVYDVIKATL